MRELRELILLTQLCVTPPSMKGEITCSKRHLKGHRSKLSFSRLGDPRVTSQAFPTLHCGSALCAVANHQVINCSPSNFEENRETLRWALISLAIRAHFLKSPKRLPRFCHQGQEADEERRRLPNVNSHAGEKQRGRGEGGHRPEMESTPQLSRPSL